jgi:CheY-like chemotaxis protein
MRLRCLIVEVDEHWVGYLKRTLASLDLETKVVSNYEDALDELQAGNYDLVTLDLSLDREKRSDWGKSLLAAIKLKRLSVPPIIVVSGSEEIDDLTDCINDYRDYIFYFCRKTAPFKHLNFINAVTSILASGREGTIESVSRLLHRVSAGLRRWTWESKGRTGPSSAPRMWHIDNEYHVQNFLWFLLSPLFPDLKDEEYTPGVGQLHPRADICIPHLNLVIEVKFWRQKVTASKLIEQIGADASVYLSASSPFKNIIAFIWDDAAQSEQHDFLIQGLKQINGVVDAIVVPRPSGMANGGGRDEQ